MSSSSSWSNVTHVSPSSDSRGPSPIPPSRASSPIPPNIVIERQSPSKFRLPSNLEKNNWTVVRRQQRPRDRPAFDIDDALQFPRLSPPVSPMSATSEHSSDDDNVVFTGSVKTALR